MFDYTIEYAYRCADNNSLLDPLTGKETIKAKCDWDERYNSQGLSVVMKDGQGYCPKCGQIAVVDKHAV